ncbi:hypothetical protein SAMN06296386_101222 [Lachnospiraceae bacterium]|nr:hypothetical protein SAMN06296386_101222 [Lachnospiraceae bacterium]
MSSKKCTIKADNDSGKDIWADNEEKQIIGIFEVKDCKETEEVKKLDNKTCEAKRLFIKPEYRGKGYKRWNRIYENDNIK